MRVAYIVLKAKCLGYIYCSRKNKYPWKVQATYFILFDCLTLQYFNLAFFKEGNNNKKNNTGVNKLV
ncbi:hypothetical protein AHMF7605_14550 [Adhaeribacter arboris]|uniref:Uncharacterized protein n=1 Tax=Adhaeribacter arboris TaxID=2072846 RepID=A0A2T2YGL8_9BACT|nr:hypothetical protein AHMF7605_14550 [Adhaeribacter arboris]